jgi:cell shape-determining protein MreC
MPPIETQYNRQTLIAARKALNLGSSPYERIGQIVVLNAGFFSMRQSLADLIEEHAALIAWAEEKAKQAEEAEEENKRLRERIQQLLCP